MAASKGGELLPAKSSSADALPERYLGSTRQLLIFPTRSIWKDPVYAELSRPVLLALACAALVLGFALPFASSYATGAFGFCFIYFGFGAFERWVRFKAKRRRKALGAGEA